MYSIAVCDDDEAYIGRIKEYIYEMFSKDCVKIFEYSDGADLVCDIESVFFDIILLDIAMPGLDGIETAKRIRNSRVCGNSAIIFISSHAADVSEIVDLAPFAYIYKKKLEEELRVKLIKAIDSLRDDESICFVSKRKYIKIRYRDIMYIQADRNSIVIHTNNEKYVSRSYSMKEICGMIRSYYFVRCHQSFLINNAYIKKISSGEVELYNGEIIPISKRYRSDMARLKR